MKFRVLLLPGAVCVYFFPSWPPSRCRVMKGEPFIITDWRKAYSCYLNLLILTSGVYLACEYVCMFLCRFKGGCLFQLASAGAPSLAALNCMIDFFLFFFKDLQESVSVCFQSPQNLWGSMKSCPWWLYLQAEQESRGCTSAATCRLISAQGHIK